MIILSYVCILFIFLGKTFYWDLSLCLLMFSLPIAIKLIIDIHNKFGKELNSVLSDTANFMRVFSTLLIIGIVL